MEEGCRKNVNQIVFLFSFEQKSFFSCSWILLTSSSRVHSCICSTSPPFSLHYCCSFHYYYRYDWVTVEGTVEEGWDVRMLLILLIMKIKHSKKISFPPFHLPTFSRLLHNAIEWIHVPLSRNHFLYLFKGRGKEEVAKKNSYKWAVACLILLGVITQCQTWRETNEWIWRKERNWRKAELELRGIFFLYSYFHQRKKHVQVTLKKVVHHMFVTCKEFNPWTLFHSSFPPLISNSISLD